MATINSIKDGNWSDSSVWDVGIPTATDIANIKHNVVIDVDAACSQLLVIAGVSLIINADIIVSGLTTLAITGDLDIAEGCQIQFTGSKPVITLNSTYNIVGTKLKPIRFSNPINNTLKITFNNDASGNFQWVDFIGYAAFTYFKNTVLIENCLFDSRNYPTTSTLSMSGNVRFLNCFFLCSEGANFVQDVAGYTAAQFYNCVFGYDRQGIAQSPAYIAFADYNTFGVYNDSVIINANEIFRNFLGVTGPNLATVFNNWGHVNNDMLPATGSDLDTVNQSAGGCRVYYSSSSFFYKTSLAARNGDSGIRVFSGSYAPTEIEMWLPIVSGQGILVTVYARRSGISNVHLILDDSSIFFDKTISAQSLTQVDRWYKLTVAGSASRQTGTIKLTLYTDGEYVDFADMTITIGDKTYLVNFENFFRGMPYPILVSTNYTGKLNLNIMGNVNLKTTGKLNLGITNG